MKKISSKIRQWLDQVWPPAHEGIRICTVDVFDVHQIYAIHKKNGGTLSEFKLPLAAAKMEKNVIAYISAEYQYDRVKLIKGFDADVEDQKLSDELEAFALERIKQLFDGNKEEYPKLNTYTDRLVHWLAGFYL